MKQIIKIIGLFFILSSISSCAYLFNKKNVEVTIDSNPQGADIFIEGRSYGRTPATISLEPKNTEVSLVKSGYGSAKMQLEVWQAIRRAEGEGGRCLADAIGTMIVIPAFSFMSVYCRDFKEPRYSVNIPYQGPIGGGSSYNNGYEDSGINQRYNAYQNNNQSAMPVMGRSMNQNPGY